jgi:hypothetical protein
MQSETITSGWFWLAAAAIVLVFVVPLATYYFLRPKPKPEKEIEKLGTGKWIPTGRIDLTDPQSVGNFVLLAEDTRVVESSTGVEHRELRWRSATLDEAKRVVMAYHAQRNLSTRANFIVTDSRTSEQGSDEANQRQEPQVDKDQQVEKNDTTTDEPSKLDSPSI